MFERKRVADDTNAEIIKLKKEIDKHKKDYELLDKCIDSVITRAERAEQEVERYKELVDRLAEHITKNAEGVSPCAKHRL